jgi:pyruvate kinase
MIPRRRTKIVATLGPATDDPAVLDRLVAAGMDVARVNCSHGGAEDLLRRAAEVRAAAVRAGRALGLLFDLQGPKLRLSGATEPRAVAVGDVVTFITAGEAATHDRVVVEFD